MFKNLINWYKRTILKEHICEEFTQWKTWKQDFSRPTSYRIDGDIALRQNTIEFTKRWQERHCTMCGKMEQRILDQ